jgi:signal transduction histidine kinase
VEIISAIQGSLSSATYVAFGLMILVTGLAFAVGVRLSHRIYGPIVPINRFIEALSSGEYTARIALRKGDDMIELKDALNRLAEALEKRHSR